MEGTEGGPERITQKQEHEEGADHRKARAIQLGTLLRDLRQAWGVSTKETAKALRLKKPYLEAVERGDIVPKWYILTRWNRLFDIPPGVEEAFKLEFSDLTGAPRGLMTFSSCFVREGRDVLTGEQVQEQFDWRAILKDAPERVDQDTKRLWEEMGGIDIEDRLKQVREAPQPLADRGLLQGPTTSAQGQ